MRQAIITKYHGPTNSRGSRISARACAGKITYDWNYSLSSDENHRTAATSFAKEFDWEGKLVGGGLPDQSGCAFVFEREI